MPQNFPFSQQELDQYANQKVLTLFARLNDQQKQWVWHFIQLVKLAYPKADHYVLRGSGSAPYMSIGQKAKDAQKGYPFFNIYYSHEQPHIWVNTSRLNENELKQKNRNFSFDGTTLDQMEVWFKKVVEALKNKGLDINGSGLMPKDYGNTVIENESEGQIKELIEDKKNMPELNQILYGPPGTGKTYATIDEALKILDLDFLEKFKADRLKLKTRFEELKLNGQIVFCTFHQSFSYEDFVEGIRAKSNAQDQLEYKVEKGVFKEICDVARNEAASNNSFELALEGFYQKLSSNGDRLTLKTNSGSLFDLEYQGGDTFSIFPQSNQTLKVPYRANLEKIRHFYKTADKVGIYNISYVQGILNYLKSECGLKDYVKPKTDNANQNKYVLIIDEINRGNISRIFGELITLIEPSKRAGKDEALEVTLPYSKDPFSVPNNVYLIGTMNTADRSLAGLDIALRRRFSFIEMPPKPELLKEVIVEGVDIEKLLTVMNQRIEALLDRDHCLGHAYFLELIDHRNIEKLAFIFQQKILPLLQEYFFEDWERIRWVLNDHRKKPEYQFITQAPSKLSDLFGKELEEKIQDRRWSVNNNAFKAIESYQGIIEGNKP